MAQVLPLKDIPMSVDGSILKYPYAGGLNTPQTYNIDLNLDGVKDVLIFDRDGDVLIPFITDPSTSTYVYAPEYVDNFGVVREWIVIRDYNQDGLDDMFTLVTPLPGIFVKKGVEIDGQLHMVDVELDNPNNILYAFQLSVFTNIQVNFGDQPEILDFDGDGDVDILNFEGNGSYLWYYKNYAVERNLGLDQFDFELQETCWGKIYESSFSQELKLSDSSQDCATAVQNGEQEVALRHSGSTVTAFDEDGDGDMDVILGDLENNHVTFLRNDSSQGTSWVTELDYTYPSYDVPVDITLFNAVFYTDVNNDGARDLIASPNLEGGFENHNCMHYYENTASDSNPNFEFRSKDLFVNDMIDLGSETSPAIADVNGDGLLDLVVGTSGEYNINNSTDARLVLLLNTGSHTAPSFQLTDNDYLGFRAFNTDESPTRNLAPTFGDLDGDGDIDMIVGDHNGYLYYLQNTADVGQAFEFSSPIYRYQDIQPGGNAKPLIYDLNQDGLNDLIIGEINGNSDGMGLIASVNYFQNIGSVGNPIFIADDSDPINNKFLGEINPFVTGYNKRSAAPAMAYSNAGPLLFVGSEGGVLFAYEQFDGVLDGAFDVYDFTFSNLNIGSKVSPAFADLDSDGLLDLVIGNQRGGLQIFRTDIEAMLSASSDQTQLENIRITPNPLQSYFHIDGISEKSIQASIMTMDGKKVFQKQLDTSTKVIDMTHLPSGVYILIINTNDQSHVEKLIKM